MASLDGQTIGYVTDLTRLDHIPTTFANLPSKSSRDVSFRKPKELPPGYKPGEFDVCCGRGKRHWNHTGNVKFRKLIQKSVGHYMDAPLKNDKTAVVLSIVEDIRNGGGLFLKEDIKGNWCDIGDQQAREKVGHSLRDQVTSIQRQKRKDEAMQSYNSQREIELDDEKPSAVSVSVDENQPPPPPPPPQQQQYQGQLQYETTSQQPPPPPPPQQQQQQTSLTGNSINSMSGISINLDDFPFMEIDEDALSDGENEVDTRRNHLQTNEIIERFARRPSMAASVTNPHTTSLSSSNSRSVTGSGLRNSSKRSSGWSFLQELDFGNQFDDFDDSLEPIAYQSVFPG